MSEHNSSVSLVMNEAQLVAWGIQLGQSSSVPLVIALKGDLGAGKTTLARAIARGAGVEGPIPSPTFNLLYRYDGDRGVRLVHIDLFRLKRAEEVWSLGWSELPEMDEMVLIEWPERADGLLPASRWEITLEEAANSDERRVTLLRVGEPAPLIIPIETS